MAYELSILADNPGTPAASCPARCVDRAALRYEPPRAMSPLPSTT
jgi:hypothetical protein